MPHLLPTLIERAQQLRRLLISVIIIVIPCPGRDRPFVRLTEQKQCQLQQGVHLRKASIKMPTLLCSTYVDSLTSTVWCDDKTAVLKKWATQRFWKLCSATDVCAHIRQLGFIRTGRLGVNCTNASVISLIEMERIEGQGIKFRNEKTRQGKAAISLASNCNRREPPRVNFGS